MLNMKNKLAKRILAFVLSGAMVISGLAPSGMTAYAAETSTEISTETVETSFEETEENDAEVVSDKAEEETPGEDSGADVKEDKIETTDEEPSEKETAKDTAPTKEAVEEVAESITEKEANEETIWEEVNKAELLKLSGDDFELSTGTDGKKIALEISTDTPKNGFTIKASAANKVTVSASNKKFNDNGTEVSVSQCIKLGGTGSSEERSIHFTTDGAGTVKVYANIGATNATSDRELGLFKGSETTAALKGTVPQDGNSNVVLSYKIESAGSYYLASLNSGMALYYIEFTPDESGSTPPAEGSSDIEASSSAEESSVVEESSEEGPSIPDDEKHTVWMVGDSTVSSFNDAYYYPRYGYGTQLQNYLDGYYTVNNIALSGRSSKSFMVSKDDPKVESNEYKALKAGIKSGDILIIGFGHNDAKQGEDDRFTDPTGDWQTEGSFAKSLYDNYVKVAEDAGATAIICTPIVRRSTGEYTGTNIHITTDKTVNNKLYKGGSYPDAIKKLGQDKNVNVVDLTTLTKELYESLGNAETLKLHAWTSHKDTSVDNTHLNIYGAKKVAYILATEIAKFSDLDIASHVKTEGKEPTEANDLKPNPSYQIPSGDGYKPPTEQSANWKNYGIFKGTVFGTVNKTISDTKYHQLNTDADGNMHIAVLENSTKISSTDDGRAMYYYQIPAASNFTFSAKAKINTIDANGQVAFGLMARDDMFIDKKGEGILSSYVAAGTFGSGSTNCFKRKDGVLEKGPALGADVQAGETYNLSIVKNPDGYACTFGDNESQSGGYDFPLTEIDDQYQYIGMFVSRNADITFSDIKLIVDDKEIEIMGTTPPVVDPDPGPGGDDDLSVEGDGGKVNVGDGLLKGKKYGYKDVATFTVLQDMAFKEGVTNSQGAYESYVITVDGVEYPGCVQGVTGPSASHAVQTEEKAVIEIKAVKDSKITFTLRQNNKPLYFVDTTDVAYEAQDIASSGNEPGNRTFYMKSGHTYQFYAGGSKVMVANIAIAKSGADDAGWPFDPEEKPSEPGTGEEKPSEPGTGEEKPSEPGTGEEKPSEPGTGEEKPSDPGTGEEEPDTPSTKIPADDKINTISISGSRIKIEAANLIVNPKKAQYNVTVTYTYTDKAGIKRQQQLTEGLHYKVSFVGASTGKEVGEQKINITGTNVVTDLGKFVNTKTVSYQLMDKKAVEKTKDITKVKAIALDKNVIKNLTYTGNYITPDVLGIDSLDAASYKIVYKNNVNAGKASVTVIGQGEYYGSKVLPYTIKPTDLSKPTAEDGLKLSASNVKEFTGSGKAYSVAEAFAYKGSPVTLQNLTLTYAGKKLRAQEDYTIAYKINVQKGTGTATIKGINNFKGSIKIDYTMEIASDIATLLGTLNTPENAVPAEFSSKGARLTEIKLSNGVTLKENADYKVKYGKECKTVTVGQKDLTVTITGAGAYKNTIAKDTPIAIEVVKGKYHIKDGTIVDAKKATDDAKLLSAAKVTDASGAKVKNVTLAQREADKPVSFITVIPSDTENYEQTTLPCRVATKLGSVKEVAKIPNQAFDGVNSVTVTKKNIEDTLGIDGKYFRIVSYKNNHKLGGATVTVEGIGLYYGTKNLKFKIVLDKIDPNKAETGATEDTSVIEDPSVEESSGTTESGDTTESSGTTESGNTNESSTEESSDTEGSSGEDPDKPTPSDKRIDVWDFGAKQEADTNKYTNYIKGTDWDNYSNLGENGKFVAADKELKFGDLTLNVAKDDRLYSSATTKTYGSPSGVAVFEYEDGYTAAGDWHCNGRGGDNRRFFTIDNVLANDKIAVYMGTSDSKETPVYFEYLGTDESQKDTARLGNKNAKLEFVAKYPGSYKVWVDGAEGNGKPIYNRVVRVRGVDVSGTIDLGPLASLDGVTLKFINDTTKAQTVATLEATNFKAKLAAGYTYTAVLSGATGYGFSNETKKVTVTDNDSLTGKDSVKLAVETKETYIYSGNITGFAEGYDISKLAVVMEADPDSQSDDIALEIKEDLSFTASLEPDVTYTIVMEGVNDYEVTSESTINKNAAYTADITVALKSMYTASGKFVDLDGKTIDGLNVTKLVLKNVEDEYEYEAAIADGGYTISLRDGAYSAVATVEGYTTSTHVVVEGKNAEKNLLFVSTAADGDLERVADLYVDKNDSSKYQTVNEAVKAAKRMKPASEAERITIHIAPGVYREQIIVQAPYVTFVNDDPSQGEVKLTWYQGIGYQYYSAKNGFYNAESAYDKFEKGEVTNWGAAVQIKATGFLAKNIVFEHSLNRYITDEELEDGVEPTATGGKPARTYSLDVNSKNATERGAALYLDTGADNAEFYQCKFLSSQDTIGTGKKGTHGYFKECFIEGGTDYICSEGSVVFDNCVLNFKGYSDDTNRAMGGYITAAKTAKNEEAPASEDLGYLFWNCTITGSKELPVAPGYFGRPWDQNAKVAFVNTKLERADIILPAGWTSMSGATPEKANFKEYNTTSLDGGAVDTSKRTAGTVKTENPVPNVEAFKAYFGNWTPKYYTAEDADVAFTTDPYLENNADLNSPHPGNTLTVKYSLGENNDKNDASIIKWYRVNDAGEETLVKASTAIAGKSYKVQTADEGNFIKAEVTPTVASGNAGTAKSIQTGISSKSRLITPGA